MFFVYMYMYMRVCGRSRNCDDDVNERTIHRETERETEKEY